jgi:hypothetical protein
VVIPGRSERAIHSVQPEYLAVFVAVRIYRGQEVVNSIRVYFPPYGGTSPSVSNFGYTCTTLQHPDCLDGQRLLDAYLRALRVVDEVTHHNNARDPKIFENASDELTAARRRYWTHVRKHKCRKTGDSTPRAQVASPD